MTTTDIIFYVLTALNVAALLLTQQDVQKRIPDAVARLLYILPALAMLVISLFMYFKSWEIFASVLLSTGLVNMWYLYMLPRVKRIYTILINGFTIPFIWSFFVAMFALLMQFLWKYVDELVGKGLKTEIIAELLFYASGQLVPMALPLAILVSSIMTFGNLSEWSELSAMKSAGISLRRIMRPIVIATFAISVGAFFFANYVQPYAQLKLGALLYDINRKRPELMFKEGSFNNDIDGFTFKVGKRNNETGMIYKFMMYDHRDYNKGNYFVIYADSAIMRMTTNEQYLYISLYGGGIYEELKEGYTTGRQNYPHSRQTFTRQEFLIKLEGFDLKRTDDNLFRENYQTQTLTELEHSSDSLKTVYRSRIEGFTGNFIKSNILHNQNYETREIDSLLKLQTSADMKVIKDLDSTLDKQTPEMQHRIIEVAINNFKSSNTFLTSTAEDFETRMRWINKHDIEWHRKIRLPVMCMIFMVIGISLGAIIKRGGFALPVVIATVIFILYYIISLFGDKLVRESQLSGIMGCWIPVFIISPIAALLYWKSSIDNTSIRQSVVSSITMLGNLVSGRRILKTSDFDKNTSDYD